MQIGIGSQGVRFMKKWITIILAVCMSVVLTACSFGNAEKKAASEETAKNPDVLIVYYSDSDIMGHVAEAIASKTGGRIVEIRRQVPFPVDLKQAMQAAREESVNHTLPPISTKIPNANSYKTVFLCYPLWWGTMPMPVFTFLQETNLTGVNLIPVAGSTKGTMDQSLDDLNIHAPGTHIKDYYFINSPKKAEDLNKWLETLGY